jgi:uncharacterized membrane protein SpoIIM required for sporulation
VPEATIDRPAAAGAARAQPWGPQAAARAMTPLQFEQLYQGEWQELEDALAQLRRRFGRSRAPLAGERIAWLYRRACGQLALARERCYPAHLTERLEQLTAAGHQLIYQRAELGAARLGRFITHGFPRAVRAHRAYVWVALAVFALPTLALGLLVYLRPELVLTMVDAGTASGLESMYGDGAESFGRLRSAQTDWQMFGYYINNNIGIAFQCFAGGLAAGIGSLFYLAYNGALGGAVGGYLTGRGLGHNFYAFIVTHSAFELSAVVLSGAAGLSLGHALLAPGRRTRLAALTHAAREAMPVMYGVVILLAIAAAVEAFWSSAAWLPPAVRYPVALICWCAVLGYLARQGRAPDRIDALAGRAHAA